MKDQQSEPTLRSDNLRNLEEHFEQDTVISETDVASAGRSCLALLALFLVIIVLIAIWLLYRSTI